MGCGLRTPRVAIRIRHRYPITAPTICGRMCELILFLIIASVAACRAELHLSSVMGWTTEKAKELSESIQSMAESVKDSMGHALGPENVNSEYCSAEGCEESQGSSRPKRNVPISSESTTEDEVNKEHDLQLVANDWLQNWNVLSSIRDILTTVKDTVQHTAYKRTAEFAENVRSVIREEFYELLEGMWDRSMGALFTEPDTLLGKFSQTVVNKIMAIGLIIICLFLDYVFWQLYFSILFILAFDGSILLMFKLWGPAWVYSKLWYMIQYSWGLLSFVWTHPYISSFVIVVLFALSVVLPIVRYSTNRSRARQVDTIEEAIVSLSVRLRRMEEKQEQILDLLRKGHVDVRNNG